MVVIDDQIRRIFNAAQDTLQHHGKLVKSLQAVQHTSEREEFKEKFVHFLKYSLVVMKREPAVERTIDFAVRYATGCGKLKETEKKEVVDEESEEESMDPFLLYVFGFLLDHHNVKDRAVRFRVTQIIGKLLNGMDDEDTIDEDLADRIYDCMMVRLKDKFPNVRCQAVVALSRLQDPMDVDCPIIQSFMHLMANDSSADVRRACICNIALTPNSLEGVLERTRDVQAHARKTAYQVLTEKVNMKALTIAQRLQLLNDGLNDRTPSIRQFCVKSLIKKWLDSLEGKVETFLECLHVETSPEISEKVLKEVFKAASDADLKAYVDQLKLSSDTSSSYVKITESKLSSEIALYWRVLAQHLAGLGNSYMDLRDELLPESVVFCNYILKYSSSVWESSTLSDNTELELENKGEFIIQQLLQLVDVLDQSDEVGRKAIQSLVKRFLLEEKMSIVLVSHLVKIYNKTEQNEDKFVQDLVEMISDVKEPMVEAESLLSIEERRSIEVQIAKVRIQLHEQMEALEQALSKDQFQEAAEIKEKMKELEAEKLRLSNKMNESQDMQHTRVEKDDPATLLKCLTITSEMLKHVNKQNLTPTIRTLVQTMIWPSVQNEDPIIREAAVHCLGLCSMLDKDFATQHLVLFVQVSQIDHEIVTVRALQILFDLLLVYGLQAFAVVPNAKVDSSAVEKTMIQISEKDTDAEKSCVSEKETDESLPDDKDDNDNEDANNSEDDSLNSAKSVLSILTTFLDSESAELRTVAVEGMAKLLLSGRVQSAKLFSRMILLWYNPTSQEDMKLRHCVGVFLPMFAFASRANQEVIEEAFLPVIEMLFNAPDTSPLAMVNLNNVIELLVHLTNSAFVQTGDGDIKHTTQLESSVHDSLAERVANYILADVSKPETKTMCRILTLLELTSRNTSAVESLGVLRAKLKADIDDAGSLKYLEKFERTLNGIRDKIGGPSKCVVPNAQDEKDANVQEDKTTTNVELADQCEDSREGVDEVKKENTGDRTENQHPPEDLLPPEDLSRTDKDVEATADRLQSLSLDNTEDLKTPAQTTKRNNARGTQKKTTRSKKASQSTATKKQASKSSTTTRGRKSTRKPKDQSSDEDSEIFLEDSETSPKFSMPRRETSKRNAKNSAMDKTKMNLEAMLDDSSDD